MKTATPLTDSDPRRLAGDRYVVEGVLGRGGAATVYRVWDTTLEVHRAAKVLSPDLSRDPDVRRRFLREARTVARLDHPHIVTVHDVGQEGDLHYIVMEQVTGGSLAGLIRRSPPVDQACVLILQVLEALEHAHAAGVVHRDIKPGNILLAHKSRALLSDFGIARMEGGERTNPAEGQVEGSDAFMSPEQREASAVTDFRGDLYGVGATLFALLTGRDPRVLGAGDGPPVGGSRVPPAVLEVILKATSYAPDERFGSARDMAEALRAAVAEVGTEFFDIDDLFRSAEMPAPELPDLYEEPPELSGPGSVTFSFGASSPKKVNEEDSEIIPDKIYKDVQDRLATPPQAVPSELRLDPLADTDGALEPPSAEELAGTGEGDEAEDPEHIHVRPRPIEKVPLKGPEKGRGVSGGVRDGPAETPLQIWSVDKRTRVLESPTHWEGELEPPPLEVVADAPLPAGSQKLLLWLAGAAVVLGVGVGLVVLQPSRIDNVLAQLEIADSELATPTRSDPEPSPPELAEPVPSGEIELGVDEVVVELVGTGGGFRDAVAVCEGRGKDNVVGGFSRGVARLQRLEPGVPCEVGLRGVNTAWVPDGPYMPGTVIACRYAGKGVICSSGS